MHLTLAELLTIPECPFVAKGDERTLTQQIAGVVTDSRQVKSGYLFFALRGAKTDGYHFIPQVFQNGALAVVVDEKWYDPAAPSFPHSCFLLVKDTLQALQQAAAYYRAKFHLPVIAVTGSVGKTTVKNMIAQVLTEKFTTLSNEQSFNNHVGVPLTLFGLTEAHEMAVVEMGANHFGEIAHLCQIAAPNYGLLTNIGRTHLEFLGSIEGVAKAKFELLEYLGDRGTTFINSDDAILAASKLAVRRVIRYGFTGSAEVKGTFLGIDEQGFPQFRVRDTDIKLRVLGQHSAQNALAAVAVGLEFGLEMDQIRQGLEKYRGAAKRMEVIHRGGVTVLSDVYNCNREAAQAALRVLAEMKPGRGGRRIAVFGDMLELGEVSTDEHRAVGQMVVSLGCDWLLTFGSASRFMAEGALSIRQMPTLHFEDKKELIEKLKEILRAGDLILIKGSRGMLMEEVTEGLLQAIKES